MKVAPQILEEKLGQPLKCLVRESPMPLSVQDWLHMDQTSFSLLSVYLHCSLSCLLRCWGLLCKYFHWAETWSPPDFFLCVVIPPSLGLVGSVSWLFESKLWMLCLLTVKIKIFPRFCTYIVWTFFYDSPDIPVLAFLIILLCPLDSLFLLSRLNLKWQKTFVFLC